MIPCELIATKLLPVIRRQMVIEMMKDGRKQREIARVLNLDESAVSHYIAKRRANVKDDALDKIVEQEIKSVCVKGKPFAISVCEICKDLRNSGKLCVIHRRNSKTKSTITPEDCKICLSKCV